MILSTHTEHKNVTSITDRAQAIFILQHDECWQRPWLSVQVSIPMSDPMYDVLILNPKRLVETKRWLGMTTEMYLVETSIESIDRWTWEHVVQRKCRYGFNVHLGNTSYSWLKLCFTSFSGRESEDRFEPEPGKVLTRRSAAEVVDNNCSVLTQQCTHNPERLWSWAGQHNIIYNIKFNLRYSLRFVVQSST